MEWNETSWQSGAAPVQSHQNDLGAGAHDTKGNAERTQPLFSPEKTKLRKKLVSTSTCWDDTCWDGVRFFFKVHGGMTKGMPWNILNFLERLWNLHLWRHSKVDNRGLSTAAWWDLLWALCWTTWLPEVPSYLNYNSVQLSNKKHRTTNGSGEGNHYLVKGNPRESKNVWLGRWKIQTHYQRWCRTWKFTYNAMFKFTETKEE